MGIKRKMRRNQKVVGIRDNKPQIADVSIASLIKGSGMNLEEAVMFLLDRAMMGIWIPVLLGRDEGKDRVAIQVAKNIGEAKWIRNLIIEKTEMVDEDFDRISEEFRDRFHIYKLHSSGDD